MATRRSKRLHSKEPVPVKESLEASPVVKKKLKSTLSEENDESTTSVRSKGKKSLPESSNESRNTNVPSNRKTRGKTKSSYFESPTVSEESELDCEPDAAPGRKSKIKNSISPPVSSSKNTNTSASKRTRGKTKSNYFESPKVSEESESDYESEPEPVRKRKPKITNSILASKKKQTYESESDSSDEFVKVETSLNSNDSLVERLTQGCKKSFESESDSSSDENSKPNDKIKVESKTESGEPNAVFGEESCLDNDVTADSTTAEYFDFTPLLSQVIQENKEEATIEEKPVLEKTEVKKKGTPEKKSKRGKKPVTGTQVTEKKDEQMEVFELLAMGENTDLSAKDIKESVSQATEEYEIPKQVEVLLDAPLAKKKKRCDDLEMALRRRLNNIRRENQVYIHKVHILCWIAHGNYVNSLLNSADILGLALSLLPSEKCYPPKRMNIEYLEDLINWFNKKVKLRKEPGNDTQLNLCVSLQAQFQKLEAATKLDLCFMFICVIRALGIKCRLIINLNVVPIKPTSDQLLSVTQKKEDEMKSVVECGKTKSSQSTKSGQDKKNSNSEKKRKETASAKNESKATNSKKKDAEETSRKSKNVKKETIKEDSKGSRRSGRLVKAKSEYFEGDTSDDEEQEKKITSRSKKSNQGAAVKKKSPKVKEEPVTEPIVEEMSSSGSDLDSADEFVTPKKKKKDRRVLSSEDEATTTPKSEVKPNKQPNKVNYWIEVFLEAEEKWASVDVYKKSYLCDEDLYKNASHPVRYVLAWNNDQTIKDVTRRYVPQYLTITRKLRVDDNWWESTLLPFKPPCTPQNREEDEELEKKLEELPLPKSISEYKNHPLYALERHLLKFQAIYPPDAPTVGFIRGEPVYSRLCVHQLHGREMWIKEAKVVKLNEKPYKVVKKRQKKDKYGTGEEPGDLELFGIWQVEDYVPPTAKDGIVPRNAFGNVELFKPSMLPKGTVYLQRLQRIANKLGIDCAAAITGFEYSTNGWSYPVKDGFVVCEEFKDVLLDAYNQEVEEAEKKEKQKREERVYGNWKRLIKGLFIAEKLKRKYNFGEPGTSKSKTESKEKKESKT